MNKYPIGFPITNILPWKGKTFYQIVASIQKNNKNFSKLSINQLMKPLPLTIYRYESHNIKNQTAPKNCNERISLKFPEKPGCNIVSRNLNSTSYSNELIVHTEIVNNTTLTAEHGKCNTPENCFSPQFNARKRCRSAGMIPRKFNLNKNNDTYSTSTQQYLVSRNRTIKQNEYNYIRKGSSGIVPGPGLAASNIYSPGGLSHCTQPTISASNNNNTFSYWWVDGTEYQVIIPDGVYDVGTLNQMFKNIQIKNKTYFIGPDYSKHFLMNISYDTNTGSIILFAGVISKTSYNANNYSNPPGSTWTSASFPVTDPIPNNSPPQAGVTYYNIHSNSYFSNIIGFPVGIYTGGINESSFQGEITPNYVTLYYKPNNPNFGVQGAVDASTRLQRLKYETITTAAGSVRSIYGDATANALAYGVSEQAYTEKTQVGDKVIYTPVVNKNNGKLCPTRHIYRL